MRISRKRFDLVAVLGNGFSENWQLPNHVEDRLHTVANLYHNNTTSKVALCGKWSINWRSVGITPPKTEARAMAEVLGQDGVPSHDMYLEQDSLDTIGNAYFLKTQIAIPHGIKTIMVCCADYHAERASFIFQKVFGKDFAIEIFGTTTELGKDPEILRSQQEVFERQRQFLSQMHDGDHSFLDNLYSHEFYNHRELDTAAYLALGRKL